MAQSPANDDVLTGQLVFSASLGRNGRPYTLILLDLNTGSQRLLDDYGNGNFAVAPVWSPDGRSFLYSMNSNSDGVYLYDVEAGRSQRIDQPTEHGGGCQAVWSPDGQHIAYMSDRESGPPGFVHDLYVYDLRTKVHRRLTHASGGFPIWSPDGQWIIYYAPARDTRTYRIRPDGSGDTQMFAWLPAPLHARAITFSPDGTRAAFATYERRVRPQINTELQQVYAADVMTGDKLSLLTPEAWVRLAPVWSPRQDRIALIVNQTDEYGTASIRLVERGRSRQVVDHTYCEFDRWNPWSPNGRAIAYAPLHGRTFAGRGISILNLDDGAVRRFATDLQAAYPVWRPHRS